MKSYQKIIPFFFATLGVFICSPMHLALAGAYVGWNVSVGGGGWYPAPYGPAWRPMGYGYGYGGYPYPMPVYAPPVAYAAPPVYIAPPQPVVLAAQPQPSVWYFCAESGKYYRVLVLGKFSRLCHQSIMGLVQQPVIDFL